MIRTEPADAGDLIDTPTVLRLLGVSEAAAEALRRLDRRPRPVYYSRAAVLAALTADRRRDP